MIKVNPTWCKIRRYDRNFVFKQRDRKVSDSRRRTFRSLNLHDEIIRRFQILFAWLSGQPPGSRRTVSAEVSVRVRSQIVARCNGLQFVRVALQRGEINPKINRVSNVT